MSTYTWKEKVTYLLNLILELNIEITWHGNFNLNIVPYNYELSK